MRRRVQKLMDFLSEPGRIFYKDRRFWTGAVLGAVFVGAIVEVASKR